MDFDLIPNQPQIDKFNEILNYLTNMIARCGGRLGEIVFDSDNEEAKVPVYLVLIDETREGVAKFCDVMNVGTVELMTTPDCEILLTVTIPDVFISED